MNNLPDDLFEDLIKNLDIQLEMRTTQKQLNQEESTIENMRYDLAEAEAMNMNTSDIIELLLNGFEGIDNLPDIEIRDEWKSIFGNNENK